MKEKIYYQILKDDLKIINKEWKKKKKRIPYTNTWISSKYVRMEFGIEKCEMLIMKKKKKKTTEGLEPLNQINNRTLGEKENYKYQGIFESDLRSKENGSERKCKKRIHSKTANFWKPNSAAEI